MKSNLVSKAATQYRVLRKELSQRFTSLGGVGDKRVLFVAGVQRSGTNMLMDVLERSHATAVYNESDPRAYQDYELIEARVPGIIEAARAPAVAFKVLCELHDLRRMLDTYPGARAIWIYRRFDDVVNSHVVKWTGMPESVRLIVQEDREAAGWRGRGMSDESHRELTSLYHPELDNPSACALFWMWRNQLFFDQALNGDPRVKLINYETFVRNPAGHFPAVFEFFGLQHRTEHSQFVSPRSIGKQQPPQIEAAVRERCEALFERLNAAAWKL
ncbi:MAG: sulfotransferase family protein [Pseudomonadota bacterium]